MSFQLSLAGIEDAQRRLNRAPELVRKAALRQIAEDIVKRSKSRTKEQLDINDQAFTPRANGKRKKLITKIVANLTILWATDKESVVGFRNGWWSATAAKNQEGFRQVMRLHQPILDGTRSNAGYYGLPATKRQAMALLAEGFVLRRAGKSNRTPSISWIKKNLTIARAGLILNVLRHGPVETWETVLPKRAFLGVSPRDIVALTQICAAQAQVALNQP
jgi:hypothetical protein